MTANLRYEPPHFAAISLNNLHGFYSDFDWSRDLTPQLFPGITFSDDHYNLPTFKLVNIFGILNLRYQLSSRWSLISGTSYGRSEPHFPVGTVISTAGWPVGVSFDATHFQGGFVYRYFTELGAVSRSDQFRATLGTRWNGFHWNGFVDRQTQVQTIAFKSAGIPGLQDSLERLGISANTPEEIGIALSETAGLLNQKFIQGISIAVTPVRTQAGSDLMWTSHAHSHQQVDFRVLYSKNQTLQGNAPVTVGTVSYSRRFKDVNEIFSSVSWLRESSQSMPNRPIFEISIRRRLVSAPNFIISRRHGNISGVVFADNGATGAYQHRAELLPDVEVFLDDGRRSRTDKSGRYKFSNVPYGIHTVEATFHSSRPFFFTTASRVQCDINSEVNFGVAFSFSRLFGTVRSDGGNGVPGVGIVVSNGHDSFTAHTDGQGQFRVEGLFSGEYEVKIDTDSVPPGYSLEGLNIVRTTVEATAPGQSAFTLIAARSISGRVTMYDRLAQKEMPVPGVPVILEGSSRTSMTDKNGTYLFRGVAPGTYAVMVEVQGKQSRREVSLPDGPAFPRNVDISVGTN